MESTAKRYAYEAVDLSAAHGVRMFFCSPGSRNTPLLLAVSRNLSLDYQMVVDERQAAFMALGYALITRQPVGLVCTSGSALLNYAPAIAEAYYRQVPLIVISADRPKSDIDIDDSQTIRQAGALSNIVRKTVDIDEVNGTKRDALYVNRLLNEALLASKGPVPGPVHINMHFDVPLNELTEYDSATPARIIERDYVPTLFPKDVIREMADELHSKRVMIVAGFMPPSAKLSKALATLSTVPNYAIIAEPLANIHAKGVLPPTVTLANAEQPDVLITIGGSLVSAKLKSYLRKCRQSEHWSVTRRDELLDTFGRLTRVIDADSESFIAQLAGAARYRSKNDERRHYSGQFTLENHEDGGWTDAKAVDLIVSNLPTNTNLQAGNGMTVRYIANAHYAHIHRIDSNRGVSGIDGCLSTAIGAAMAYSGPTALIIGDMSLRYDISALSVPEVPERLTIFVLNNNGGDIFRRIPTTSQLPECETMFVVPDEIPLKKLASAYGYEYFEARDEKSLTTALKRRTNKKTIINVITR